MRRRIGLVLMSGAMLPLAAASVAWACGALATLTLDKKVAAPGEAIAATGKNYGTAAGVSAVTIRLKSRNGTLLATTAPSPAGRLSESFRLPTSLSPGWYVVMATQFNANGTPRAGTPGRTTIRVQGAASRSNAEVVGTPWSSSNPSGPAGSEAPFAGADNGSGSQSFLPILLAALLSGTMLAAGWTLVARRNRAVSGPQFGV